MSPQPTGTAAFAFRDFRRYQLARVMVIMGAEAQSVGVAWQVYELTHKAIDLGYTGLALFLPGLLFLLPAGHVADRYDRRRVVLVCYTMQILCTTALLLFALRGMHHVLPIFGVLFLIGTGRAFSGPASSALLPHLVPQEHFVNAVTWGRPFSKSPTSRDRQSVEFYTLSRSNTSCPGVLYKPVWPFQDSEERPSSSLSRFSR